MSPRPAAVHTQAVGGGGQGRGREVTPSLA